MAEILQSAVAPNGDVYILETGGRIVRCGNPLTGDRSAEVVYLGRERMDGLCVSPDGALHAVGDRYHTNAGGTWRKEKVPRTNVHAELVCVWAPSVDDIWVGGREEVLRRGPGGWSSSPAGITRKRGTVHTLGGTSPNDVYAVGNQVTHFDGESWKLVPMPAIALYLGIATRGDAVYIVGRTESNLFVGSGTSFRVAEGVRGDLTADFHGIATMGDQVYISTGQRLLLWDGAGTRVVIESGGYDVSSNGTVVATSGHDGVHVLARGEWQFFPSAPKDAVPAGTKSAAKKKPAATRT